jgi:diguanylate cyclase (GGDEF)-like protein/PAS domain S-box-containing protein
VTMIFEEPFSCMSSDDRPCPPFHEDPEFYKRVLVRLHDGVYFTDRERRILFWNEAATRITGYTREESVGKLCQKTLMHSDATGQLLCASHCPLGATLADGKERDLQGFVRHKSGQRVPVRIRVNPIFSKGGEMIGAAEVFSDESAHRKVTRRAEEMERLAFRDGLTQVANRRYVEVKLQTALQEYQLHHDPFGLMLIDLDHFKQINDQYGHETGDRALVSVTQVISGALRSTDTFGRWGGDEFVAVVGHINGNSLWQLASRCCALVGMSRIQHGDECISVTVSIGGAIFRGNEEIQDLIARADKMLYVSKEKGRARATVERFQAQTAADSSSADSQ